MTRKKPVRVPTDDDLVERFTAKAFKDMLAASLPRGTDIERYADATSSATPMAH
jgi:hypothetical protein